MAAITSDNIMSDIPPTSSRGGTPKARTPRTRGPPSSAGAPSLGPLSDDEGFADDQIPQGPNRARKSNRPVPRVHDPIGEIAQGEFGEFLESFVDP